MSMNRVKKYDARPNPMERLDPAPSGIQCPEYAMTRREFVAGISVLAGAATLAALLPMSSRAFAVAAREWGQVPPIDTGRDEALGNYPGYADAIEYGRGHLLVVQEQRVADPQLYA